MKRTTLNESLAFSVTQKQVRTEGRTEDRNFDNKVRET